MEIVHNISEKMRRKGCPWGKRCDDCNLYRPTYGSDDKGNVIQEWDCQINNLVMLTGEMKGRTMGVQAAVESFRNSVADDQKRLEQNGMRRKQISVSVP